ncbi:unnamed protein product [Durusdinium trenchii]|uniref:USP domain-containing protein n=1 Tax=Durusdinium trenchii TaxID=1381693 RepID=A0ABP0LCV3_9DINO
MNAAIQCLVHSPLLPEYFKSEYKFDVNLNTKFGMAGKLAVAFAELLRDIHNARETGSGVVAPRDFKRIFSDFKPQFAGWKQQDSQEFLSMFLAGLSEDVNRTTKKPYRELKDSEGRPDDEVALEYWQAHCLREATRFGRNPSSYSYPLQISRIQVKAVKGEQLSPTLPSTLELHRSTSPALCCGGALLGTVPLGPAVSEMWLYEPFV